MADWSENPPKWQESPVQSGHFGRIQVLPGRSPGPRPPRPGRRREEREHLDGCGCPRPQGPRRRRDGCEQRYRLRNGSRFHPRACPHDPGLPEHRRRGRGARAAGADGAGGEHGGPATRLGEPGIRAGLRRRFHATTRSARRAGEQCRRRVHPPHKDGRRLRAAVRHEPPRALRPDRPTVRPSRVHPGRARRHGLQSRRARRYDGLRRPQCTTVAKTLGTDGSSRPSTA